MMHPRSFTPLLLLLLLCMAFAPRPDVSEAVKQRMFCTACSKPMSTSHDYVVVKVKNLKTGEIKEVCTTTNLLEGALWRETGKLVFKVDCKMYPNRYFQFAQDSALWNIGFADYSTLELKAFARTVNIDSVVQQIRKGTMETADVEWKYMRYFAHLMFNRGVITTSGCFGTSVTWFPH